MTLISIDIPDSSVKTLSIIKENRRNRHATNFSTETYPFLLSHFYRFPTRFRLSGIHPGNKGKFMPYRKNEMSRPEIPFFQLIGNWQNTMTTHTEHTKISASIISETIPFIFQFLSVYCLYLQYIIL